MASCQLAAAGPRRFHTNHVVCQHVMWADRPFWRRWLTEPRKGAPVTFANGNHLPGAKARGPVRALFSQEPVQLGEPVVAAEKRQHVAIHDLVVCARSDVGDLAVARLGGPLDGNEGETVPRS